MPLGPPDLYDSTISLTRQTLNRLERSGTIRSVGDASIKLMYIQP